MGKGQGQGHGEGQGQGHGRGKGRWGYSTAVLTVMVFLGIVGITLLSVGIEQLRSKSYAVGGILLGIDSMCLLAEILIIYFCKDSFDAYTTMRMHPEAVTTTTTVVTGPPYQTGPAPGYTGPPQGYPPPGHQPPQGYPEGRQYVYAPPYGAPGETPEVAPEAPAPVGGPSHPPPANDPEYPSPQAMYPPPNTGSKY